MPHGFKLHLIISDRTTLTLEGEYLSDQRPIDRGIVAIGDKPADLPVSRFLGDASRKNIIEPEFLSFVFERFRQAESSNMRGKAIANAL